MNLFCVAVFDSAVQAYNRPFWSPSRAAAVRSFTDEARREGTPEQPNPLRDHPEDFEMHCLFELDDNTGLVSRNTPEVLLRAKDVQTS